MCFHTLCIELRINGCMHVFTYGFCIEIIKLCVYVGFLENLCFCFSCMLQFNPRWCFPQGATSQLRSWSKPLGTATVSIIPRVYPALFQNLKFCELGRRFLQTSSPRDLKLAPMTLTKTWLRVELIARESSEGPCDLGLGTLR
jgi:hypothetical protein